MFLQCVSTVIIVYIVISPLNSYLYIHWILDFKSILLLLLLFQLYITQKKIIRLISFTNFQLYITQKKIIRLISFTNYDIPSAVTFKNLEILPLNKLVYNRIGIMMYKYSNNLLPPAINYLYFLIMMFTNTLQDKSIYFMLTRVTLMFTRKVLET